MNAIKVLTFNRIVGNQTTQKDLSDAQRLSLAYREALGRAPTPGESKIALSYLERTPTNPEARLAAWERVYQVVFACVDFRYVD